ncbi:hypothetical protein [Thermosulfurimonas sp. F29]|uniref:hypothetical protein n=1 Tax=Thermosulfurimonas sp. F29 TaxID=2867247 RepID=UPI001C82F390|nr:hypothetical protein [Thermosulfurimonas sp. F29]MBX6423613.1 hypothetical protein [Thermosulfurimonas sp. F29]
MYLARKRTAKGYRYYLRVSVKKGACWEARDLLCLGEDPSAYLRYPGGKAFYVSEELEETLRDLGVETDQWELERIFFRFVKPEIREYLRPYVDRSRPRAPRFSRREQLRLQATLHPFDCRRLVFLKLGSGRSELVLRKPLPFLNQLLEKSRDEIEQLLWDYEDRLRPREVVSYIYHAFALWDYFPGALTRYFPEARLQKDLDEAFLRALCETARDESYRMGLSEEEVLRDYLSRYVILYFDTTEAQRRFFEESRSGRWARREVLVRAARYFGLSPEALEKMGRRELLRLFRERAKELHPDRGGSKEAFILLRRIFEELMEALGYRRRF